MPFNDQVVEGAVNLTTLYPLRGYDAVHLSAAMILNASLTGAGLSLEFVAADNLLCEAARGEDFCTINPNDRG